jgi:hypothetical protein
VSNNARVIVLVEDQRHEIFIRRYLYQLGYGHHDIRFEPLPNGRGCGEQWVRDRCSKVVAIYRARQAQKALLIVIDADKHTVAKRISQLPGDRSESEAIAFLVPKRHIETWILCLHGERVDEQTDYHLRKVDHLIKPAAVTLRTWMRTATLPPHCVDSLRTAFAELQRIPSA